MTKEEKIKYYINYKRALKIIYGRFDTYYIDDKNTNIEFLTDFKKIVDDFTSKGYLDDYAIGNILRYVEYIKQKNDSQKEERKQLLDSILELLKGQEKDRSAYFYKKELISRRNNLSYLQNMDSDEFEKLIPYIRKSISNDIEVLETHLSDMSFRRFMYNFKDGFATDIYYYESINSIINECPEILQVNEFQDKVDAIINSVPLPSVYNNPIRKIKLINSTKKRIKKITK